MSNDVQVISLTCNHCGAPLDVPEETRFATCAHCGSRLEIHRTGSAAYTQVLDQIDRRTRNIEQEIEALRLQQELEQLDRDWERQRAELLDRDRRGRTSPPDTAGAIIGPFVMCVFGAIWIATSASSGAPGAMSLLGLGIIVAGIIVALVGVGKAARYQDAQTAYHRRRTALLARFPQSP
jgi:hypothetical protein